MWRAIPTAAARAAASVARHAATPAQATARRLHNAAIARQLTQTHAANASAMPAAVAATPSPPASPASPTSSALADLDDDDDDPDSAPAAPAAAASSSSKKKSKKSSLRSLGVGGAIPGWEVVVGIEVHAQIVAASKLFSGASTRFGAAPNAHASAVDAAMPGMLPALNAHAVAQAVRTGLGLGGAVQAYSCFERKHYFYCDMPQGYQITQQSHPIVRGGGLKLDSGATVRIARIQIEQDSGKNIHDLHPTRSFVDLNRAGVGLMEIVSEPDMRGASEAADYIRKLTAILQQVGTCRAHMEDGSLRCDVNVSVRRVPTDAAAAPASASSIADRALDPLSSFGERVEVKNLNSLRSLQRAIDHEFHRQVGLASQGQPVRRETRGFDAKTGSTVLMRTKEQMLDYRFAPEPDLPPLILNPAAVRALEESMPELPAALAARFQGEYGLNAYDTGVLLAEPGAAAFMDRMVFGPAGRLTAARGDAQASNRMVRKPKLCANWLANELFGRIKKQRETAQAAAAAAGIELAESSVSSTDDSAGAGSFSGAGSRGATMASAASTITPETLGALVDLLEAGRISGKSGKALLDLLLDPAERRSPAQIARDQRMELDQSGGGGELLESTVAAIVAAHPTQILEAHAGNKRVFGYLAGQVLKLAGKQAQISPSAASKRLMEKIAEEVAKQAAAAAGKS